MISSSKKVTPVHVYSSDQFEDFSCVDSVAAYTNWTVLIQVQYSGINFMTKGIILTSADSLQ